MMSDSPIWKSPIWKSPVWAVLTRALPIWGLLLSMPAPVTAQVTCPRASGIDAEAGWTAYRDGAMARAAERFEAALDRCPDDLYARTGLGYVRLREGSDRSAREHFEAVVAVQPDNVDALVGLGLLAWRSGSLEEVRTLFQRVVELAPDHPTALDYLGRLPEEAGAAPERPPLVLPDTLVFPARAHGDRFEVRGPDGWEPFYLKGMNLGAALPGRHPSEFPDSATYAAWIAQMAEMNVNVVRVYTIHPPSFYEALLDFNRGHPDRPLYLVHGVWTELPQNEAHDYLDPSFEGSFFAEMRRVVDLVHGRADLEPRPGHASGFYTADVSRWTLAYIIGREWEPYSSLAFDSLRADFDRWDGDYVALAGGNAMEAWLAKAVDRIVSYETATYRAQRPVAYTNWPTLDPMRHPSESTRDEEVSIREALGERVDFRPREYDNDALSLDATKMRATEAFPAGIFASYHAYPYYPDFMALQPSYREASSSLGPSTYFGYLTELKARHPGMPVVISEYGVPASFGSAHLQPLGWHHGGLTEDAMASIDRRMTLELAEAGMAGGALFAWIDEWFKKNWLVIDFEQPLDRNRLWYNRLDAEQQYGMLALEAEPPFSGRTLDERRIEWAQRPALHDGPEGTLRADWDDAYLWLLIETPERPPGARLYVGLDMIDPGRGDRRWPGARGPLLPVGLEFVVVDDGRDVRVLADPPVNPWEIVEVGQGSRVRPGPEPDVVDPPDGLFTGRVEQRFNVPFRSVSNDDGRYDTLRVVSNRRRIGRDSVEYQAIGYDRGWLPGGPGPEGFWERDGDAIEIRIPWLLVNVTDPSSRSVLSGVEADSAAGDGDSDRNEDGRVVLPSGEVVMPDSLVAAPETTPVDDIGIVAALERTDGVWTVLSGDEANAVPRFTWPTWDAGGVRWRARRRRVFDVMRDTYAELDPYRTPPAAMVAGRAPPEVPPVAAQQVDSADIAWRAGETERAVTLYLTRLERNPADDVALHRVALAWAWDERYEESLELFDRLLAVSPADLDARVDRARVRAWSGDIDTALNDLEELLGEHPQFTAALEARATFEAWAGRYEEAVSSYDQLLAIAPDNAAARRQQAKVLSWASRYDASRALYDSVLAAEPGDIEARLGLAQVMTFSDDLDGAEIEYRRVLDRDPTNRRALQGLGRTLSWAGRLVAAEDVLRASVASDTTDVSGLVGLAQNLRWQGRNAAALEVLERARRIDPANGDVREQLRWVRVALGSRVRPSYVVEDDSDDNHMVSASLAANWHPWPRLGVRADVYRRTLDQNALSRSARGVTFSGSWIAEPGWTLSAGLGGSDNDGGGKQSFVTWSLGVGSPGRYPVMGSVALSSRALDATAILAERGVRMTELSAAGRWVPAPGWRFDGSMGRATFTGTERNRRLNASLSASRRLTRAWTVGVGGRAFGFRKDLGDGYFDPDFYGIAEVTGRWLYEFSPWSFLVEMAPGIQQVTKSGEPAGAYRVSARAAFQIGPGREVSLSGGYSSTGLQSFSTGASDYRYTALILGGSWVF